jgi:protein TonB
MKTLYLFFAIFLLYFSSTQAQEPNYVPEQELEGIKKIETDTIEDIIGILWCSTPEFVGGSKGLQDFLHKNIKLPRKTTYTKGTVYVKFTVCKDGRIMNIQIVKGLQIDYDMEVLRVISLMPKWIPAKNNREPVETNFVLPIKFR